MIRDAFYKQILERLAERLDDDLFEVCAASLLRSDFPTLVPVRGETDSGMDGATASGGPFLICTTGKDVIRNLTKNLDSYKRSGGTRRGVLVATSQELTQKKRANLEERARSASTSSTYMTARRWRSACTTSLVGVRTCSD